ncbi:MAG: hypothetical protein ACRD3W_21755, partial [Terriglobales bacterium]
MLNRMFRLLVLCALSLTACAHSALAAGRTGKVWVLEQRSMLQGEITLYVAADVLKIVCHANHYAIICRAPDWKVWLYNFQSKTILAEDARKFAGRINAGQT